ncbi:glycosyltransferase [Massilia arenae]|uniref:Glycosyltransferase family 1 protein n=1 Tax=Massilia arenae TaxID=2603288 RepID=A0A5C7G1B6_9BURK|nr:glycosyltransferase [Massilia arenae]TXF96392.1 glycosyltransferase family 1 protein [Massilia arenae]
MHFILATIGSAGDLFPFLWIGRALSERGNRVDFLGPEQHAQYVEAAGLTFHGLPADMAVLDHPDLWHATRGLAVVWEATRPAMAQLPRVVEALARKQPNERRVLLVHPLALPEADLCRHTCPGLKIAAAWLAPSNLPTVHDPLLLGPWPVPAWVPHGARRWLWRALAARFVDPVALPGLNTARVARGLPQVGNMVDYIPSIPDLSLALFPDWFAAPPPDWPRPLYQADFPLYDPDPNAAPSFELRAFLDGGAPPVVFTPGTGNRQARAYFEAAQQAVTELGLRAVFLTPHAEQLPAPLAPNVCWQDYVPLKALLPHVAALVHHGGIGTTAEALRAGTPQLIVPLAHDQFDNAARVVAMGAGASLHAARVTPARMTKALQEVVGSTQIAAQSAGLAARFAGQGGIDGVCARLETLA